MSTIVDRIRAADPTARIGIGGSLVRAISQRPNEAGQLFFFGPNGHDDEIRIVAPDGNAPFTMRLNTRPYPSSSSCTVDTVDDALHLILATIKAIQTPYDGTGWALPDRAALLKLWADPFASRHADLPRMSDALCARDDRRRLEDNPFG